MALSHADETDLLVALHAGPHEAPRWATFLRRLRQRTRAERASLVVVHGPGPSRTVSTSHRRETAAHDGEADPRPIAALDGAAHETLRPGRVYGAGEFGAGSAPAAQDGADPSEAEDARVVRVVAGTASAVMAVARRGRPFSAGDGAVLSALAPHLAVALHTVARLAALEFRATAGEAALSRCGAGWIAFDPDAGVVDFDPVAAAAVAAVGGLLRTGQRLQTPAAEVGRALVSAAADFADGSGPTVRPLVLSNAPRLDAVLLPPSLTPEPLAGMAAMLALLRAGPAPLGPRAPILTPLFGLTGGEARLAAALCDGYSIAEAAARMGVTLETARNYSKRVYTAVGVRGQAELVRAVLLSSATLA
jgi:DNA-binding CsgD family transcriptional regulator